MQYHPQIIAIKMLQCKAENSYWKQFILSSGLEAFSVFLLYVWGVIVFYGSSKKINLILKPYIPTPKSERKCHLLA